MSFPSKTLIAWHRRRALTTNIDFCPGCFILSNPAARTSTACQTDGNYFWYAQTCPLLPKHLSDRFINGGAPCGSIYIDKAFDDVLLERGILQQLSNDERYKLRQQFILRKESFTNDESRPHFHVELPRDGIQGDLIVAGFVQISR